MYARAIHSSRLHRRRPTPAWKIAARRIAMGAAVFVILVFAMAQAVHGSATGGYMTVTVQPGDSVWSIASHRYPEADTREKVQEILDANRLGSPEIYAGEQLKVPTT
jgi:nucleoid-associated protein YgaU